MKYIPLKDDLSKSCDLLREAIEAHGGLERWLSVQEFVIRAKTGGIALPLRFQPGAFRYYEAHISTTEPRTTIFPHPGGEYRGVFESTTVQVLDPNMSVVQERKNARRFFTGFRRKFYWDDLDVMYFGGYALWNYLNLPFILASPGVIVNETDPWKGDKKTLRRLHAVFPEDMPTHCREQTFYFDSDNLLVRHDYTAEVFGQWAKASHYSWKHRNFDGIVIPTRRKVYPRKASNDPFRMITLVSIRIDSVTLINRGK